jgi:hypothetical protein
LNGTSDIEIIEMVYRAWHGQFGGDRHRPALVESVRAEYERSEYEPGEYRYHGGEEDYHARKGRLSLPR